VSFTWFKVPGGGGWVNSDDGGTDVVFALHFDGKIDFTETPDLRFEMSWGRRPLRVHVLSDRAKLFPSR
jgi:hypothetical protein